MQEIQVKNKRYHHSLNIVEHRLDLGKNLRQINRDLLQLMRIRQDHP